MYTYVDDVVTNSSTSLFFSSESPTIAGQNQGEEIFFLQNQLLLDASNTSKYLWLTEL